LLAVAGDEKQGDKKQGGKRFFHGKMLKVKRTGSG
jgi:hypothetical protein